MTTFTAKHIKAAAARRSAHGLMSALTALLILTLGVSVALGQAVPFLDAPLSPGQKAPGASTTTLTVHGTGFASDATVYWNGNALTTTFVTESKLTASIPSADLTTAETAVVTVKNGSGVVSNADYFEVVKSGYTVAYSKLDYSTASSPNDVTTADFNGDGIPDLALAAGGNNVSLLLGAGGGSFAAAVNYAVPGSPVAIAHGDFTGAGYQDIVTADQFSSQVSVLINNGNGTFQSAVQYATGNEPVGVAVADVNGDGILDIITVNYNANTVSVLLGQGGGIFAPHVDYACGNGPEGLAIGDFNDDGYLDIATANNTDGTVSILLGNGNGTFQTAVPYTTGVNPTAVATGITTSSGYLDLAVATSNKSASVLLGNGNGTFQNYKSYATGSGSVAIALADLSSAGVLDIITANYNDNTISTLVGNGNGTFKSEAVFPSNTGPSGLAIGGFTGDGKLNVAMAASTGNTVSVFSDSLITFSPELLPFSTQTSGDPSAAKTVTMKNNGTTAYTMGTLSQTGAYYTDFSETHTCPAAGASLAAGASCTFSVVFDPQASETANAQYLITNANGSDYGWQMTGSGNIPINLAPRTMTFKGYQLVGTTSKPQTDTFTNESGVDIYFSNILLTGVNQSEFTFTTTCGNNNGVPLAPGASCTSSVYFVPTGSGGANVTQVYYGNFTQAEQGLLISGEATCVAVSPTSITFPSTVDGQDSTATVTFQNACSTPLAISSITFTNGTENYFSLSSNTCNFPSGSVPANSSCTLTVEFAPLTAGTFTANMNIGDPDPTGPQVIKLTGTGTAAPVGAARRK